MKRIVYEASFGMEKKVVDLGFVPGGGGTYQLMEDNYYQAKFKQKKDGTWKAHFHRLPWWMTGADIEVLCDLIAQLENNPEE